MNYLLIVTVIVYIVIIVLAYYAIKMEYTDLKCPSTKGNEVCGNGRGVAYIQGKPNADDDVCTLISKIGLSSKYESNSVKWRRCLIFSIIVTFAIFGLILCRLPNGQELLISILILYIASYLLLIFYYNSISRPAVKQIDQSLELLKSKLNLCN